MFDLLSQKRIDKISLIILFKRLSMLSYLFGNKSFDIVEICNQLFNIKDFKQVQVIEYLSALLIIFKRLDDRRVVHRQRKSKKSKVLEWPTKNELKKFREIKSGKHY